MPTPSESAEQTPSPTALEASFAALCAAHDLTALTVEHYPGYAHGDGDEWGATAHWDGFAAGGIACASGSGPSIGAALDRALTEARTERHVQAAPLADEPLPAVECAA